MSDDMRNQAWANGLPGNVIRDAFSPIQALSDRSLYLEHGFE